jgi:hypothetical protein
LIIKNLKLLNQQPVIHFGIGKAIRWLTTPPGNEPGRMVNQVREGDKLDGSDKPFAADLIPASPTD